MIVSCNLWYEENDFVLFLMSKKVNCRGFYGCKKHMQNERNVVTFFPIIVVSSCKNKMFRIKNGSIFSL